MLMMLMRSFQDFSSRGVFWYSSHWIPSFLYRNAVACQLHVRLQQTAWVKIPHKYRIGVMEAQQALNLQVVGQNHDSVPNRKIFFKTKMDSW